MNKTEMKNYELSRGDNVLIESGWWVIKNVTRQVWTGDLVLYIQSAMGGRPKALTVKPDDDVPFGGVKRNGFVIFDNLYDAEKVA